MSASLRVSPEAMAAYRASARRRQEETRQALARRQERAWEVAKQAAALLKERFGTGRVVAFGSLTHEHWFSTTSDIDLAVWDLDPNDYFVAVAQLQDLSPEFKIDLVAMERCKSPLREAIIQEGRSL